MELKRERRKDQPPVAVKKTSVGVLIDERIWKEFRILCIKKGEAPGNVLTNLIRDYLKKQDRQ